MNLLVSLSLFAMLCGIWVLLPSQRSNLSPCMGAWSLNYWTARKFLFSLLDEDSSLQACCTSAGGSSSVLSRVNDFFNWWRNLNHFLLFTFSQHLEFELPNSNFRLHQHSYSQGCDTCVCTCVCICVWTKGLFPVPVTRSRGSQSTN